jgi:lipoic acid synthetase
MEHEYLIKSGLKIKTPQGFTAIKDGIKLDAAPIPNAEPKPAWLKIRVEENIKYQSVKDIVKQNKLSTVCEEAKCPNINECWSAGTATIMIMGSVCTRACRFCSVDTGNPKGWLDPEEPEACARAVKLMGLKYVVITSVDRDDLPDGGAQHYAACVRAIKKECPQTAVEVLTPDFEGSTKAIDILLETGIEVFAQNVETVKRLTHPVRDPRAGYQQTLDVLAYAKKTKPSVLVKTSLMLGLGETDEEIMECLDDLKNHGVDIVTFGQYLRPTLNHLPVERYVTPAQFDQYRDWGLAKGFLEIVSGPFVRSSYRAEKVLEKNNVGLS